MGKLNLKSRKRKEQTIAIVIVAAVILIVTAAILLFVASNNSELGNDDHNNDSQATELTLKLAVDAHEGEVHYNAAKKFKEQVESRTGGAVDVEIYSTNKLGGGKALVKALEQNEDVVDVVITSVSDFTEIDERMDISALPFMFESEEDAWNFMSGEIQQEVENAMLEKNIHVLTHYAGDVQCITTTSKVLNNAMDIKNLSIAASEGSDVSIALQMMNARMVVLEENAISQAILQKKCDGYMGSLEDISNNYIYQNQDYLAVTYHTYDGLAFAISESTWKELGSYQEIVQEAAKSSAYTDRELMKQQTRTMIDRIKAAGVKVLYPDLSSFGKETESFLRGYSSKYGTLIDKHIMDKNAK